MTKNPANPFPKAPKPKSALARYRLLSPTAGVRVSPLCIGGMSFGDAWEGFMGACDKETTESILDYYYEQGGNFIDTANNYQFEQSEEWIGDWMLKRNNRDQMVIATKYTTCYRSAHADTENIINTTGNSTKSLVVSVNSSLKKLKTDYIDLLYVHWWDYSTGIPELMQSLNHLVAEGKVLYLGITDTPAWVVSKANEYARNHGLRQFSVYQGRWSAADRDFETDIIPMVQAEGMALAPWGSLGGGQFKSEKHRAQAKHEGRQSTATEAQLKVSRVLEAIASEKGASITGVALAYVMHKAPYVFPIVGGRSVAHLKGNIEALSLVLSRDDMDRIEAAAPLYLPFPHNFVWSELEGEPKIPDHPGDIFWSTLGGYTDHVPLQQPIKPSPPVGQE